MKIDDQNHRKLLQLYNPGAGQSPQPRNHREIQNTTTAPSPASKIHSALDSSMALTILVLLTALFFMGFFSIYIHRFAGDTATGIDSRPRRRSNGHNQRGEPRGRSDSRKGLDSQALRSLPVYRYGVSANHRLEDCAICLSEFEEGESVKVIPSCMHVFHVPCLDTWLSSHVSCPVCRNTELITVGKFDQGVSEVRVRSTVQNDDTSMDLETAGVRRISSCSTLEQRASLHRTWSF